MKPVVVGCRTLDFTSEQLDVFKTHQPFGMIIFAEPFKAGPETIRHVVGQFKDACPDGKIFIDVEGGRVNRMKPEFNHGWRDIPAARDFAKLAETDLPTACVAIKLNAQLIGYDLMQFGISIDCAPVVDLVDEEVIQKLEDDGKPHATSASLFQRSFGSDPHIVTACARAFTEGLHSMGVTSILKHMPGYGRVASDPHYGGDVIKASLDEMLRTDLMPYKNLSDHPAVMTAHTVYSGIDPAHVGTLSKKVIGVMRNEVGFKGVIITDTIEMNSIDPDGFSKTEKCQFGMGLPLPGTIAAVTQKSLAAGCDLVMHSDCSRNFQDTIDMLEAAPVLAAEKSQWLLNKMTMTKTVQNFDYQDSLKRLNALINTH